MPSRSLPAHPNLVFYRKQAKALVKLVREGNEAALRRVRATHPRLHAASKRARPDHDAPPFTLADAQLVVARELGAASWPELKRRLQPSASGADLEPQTPGAPTPNDDVVRDLLTSQPADVAFVVGLLDQHSQRIAIKPSEGASEVPSGDTALGVSALPFTGLVFADLVRRRRLNWTDPLSEHLPRTVRVPKRRKGAITLLDLITGTSGLPTLPAYAPIDPRRAFSDFTVARLNEWLDHIEFVHDDVRGPMPSFVALWLLQLALAHRGEASFDLLLRALVLDPLHMSATRSGGDDTLAGAVGLRTTARDLLLLLQAFIVPSQSPLRDTVVTMLQVRNASALEHAIGWACSSFDHAFSSQRHALAWADGWTPGCRTFFGYSRRDKRGAVVAAITDSRELNLNRLHLAEYLGLHLLDERWSIPA